MKVFTIWSRGQLIKNKLSSETDQWNLVEPDVPLEPIRRDRRDNNVDENDEKNKKQLEFNSFVKKNEENKSKVLKLKDMKQMLDNDYKVQNITIIYMQHIIC